MDPTGRPQRTRTRTGFSVRSDKSSNSGKSHAKKASLVETSAEKRKRHLSATTKANPNNAINEAQPVALALEKSTLISLQNIKCNDVYGDPDRSNPTRWRMERPLDTIRSFEVAIDRAHHQRQSTYLQPGGQSGYQSQRSSTYMGNGNGAHDNGNRSSNYIPNNGQYGVSRESFAENYGYGPPPPRHASRMPPEQAINRYATPGASSGSEQWTGPASEESSLDHANGIARPVPPQHAYSDAVAPGGQYPEEDWSQQAPRGRQPGPPPHLQMAPNGYSPNGNGYPNGQGGAVGGYAPANGYGQNYAPAGGYYPPNQQQPQQQQQQMSGGGLPRPPPKETQQVRRKVISLNNPNPETANPAPQRKSWLKRFSRSGK